MHNVAEKQISPVAFFILICRETENFCLFSLDSINERFSAWLQDIEAYLLYQYEYLKGLSNEIYNYITCL